MKSYTYSDFAEGPGGEIAHRLGVPCDKAATWAEYTARFQRYAGDSKSFARLRSEIEGLSRGEVAIACAMLHAVDYSWLADEVEGGQAWRRLDSVSGAHRSAVVAAILRQDT